MKKTTRMNAKEAQQTLESRIGELKGELAGLVNNEAIKESTKSTRRHALRRDLRIALLLVDVISSASVEELQVSEEALLGFNQLCFPSDGGSKVTVEEGDSILLLMERFADTRDLLSKLNKAADRIGCRLDFTTGVVVKK